MATQTPNRGDTATQRTIGGRRALIRERTLRTDRWWIYPAKVWVGLGLFTAYALYVAFVNDNYWSEPYLSPFYSPCVANNCVDNVYPHGIPLPSNISPALLILLFPALFRASCYYYRKSTYRSFFGSPPACAVGEPAKRYSGEMAFPFTAMNQHRYTWYIAVLFVGFLSYDAYEGFFFPAGVGIGVGTGVLVVNAILIAGYTFGCHSCRHITGGRINNFSKHPLRYRAWTLVGKLNKYHEQWAWYSMFWIAGTDLYIRLVAAGVFNDPRWIF